jgi:hypothetical protein
MHLSTRLNLLLLVVAAAASAQTTGAGKVNFFRLSNPTLDPSLTNTPPAQQKFFNSHFTRMGVFSPYFDSRSSWYPNGLIYQDLYAIYNPSATATQHPDWILHDSSGNPLYIPWGCANGTCPQYSADIANPAFRAWWIAQAQANLSNGNYKGLWIDDVNMDFDVGDGAGNLIAPIDDATGAPMTWSAWRNYVAQFLTQIRQSFPTREIVHNPVWYAGPSGVLDLDPAIQAQIAAADVVNIERGIGSDPGITGGKGPFSLYSLLSYIDRVHSAGRNVLLLQYDLTNPAVAQYALAGYFLISSGGDFHGDTSTVPANWWSGLNTNLGDALGPRTYSEGVFQRNFSQGMVLIGEPGITPQTINLPASFQTLDGVSVNSVTISERQGVILTGPYPTNNALALTTTALHCAIAGTRFYASLTASGGSGRYTFSVSNAPPGLTVSDSALIGTASAAGAYNNVIVTVIDAATNASAQQTFSMTVYAPLTVANSELPPGTVGAAYRATVSAAGGSGNFLWAATGLPEGLALNSGSITGTPATSGVYPNVTVTVTDLATNSSAQARASIIVRTLVRRPADFR